MESENRKRDETAGGFNPDRPEKSDKPQVGPLPTDDPKGNVGSKVRGKKPKVDPSLKPTSSEKTEKTENDAFPAEGAAPQRRGDKERPGL
jgi:hypothetical protein